MVTLTDLKHKLITFYQDIEKVYCPALEANMHFTRAGYRHVLGIEKGQKRRRTKEAKERLQLLRNVPHLLAQAHHIDESRIQKSLSYHAFIFLYQQKKVKIVVVKRESGDFVFKSVFEMQKNK